MLLFLGRKLTNGFTDCEGAIKRLNRAPTLPKEVLP